MPKRKGGVVSDEFVVGSGDEESHATKKSKAMTGKASVTTQAKDKDTAANGAKLQDDSGDAYWELKAGGTRRVGISTFNSRILVNIREFYQKDGKSLPGKKGISLPLDQFSKLVEVLPQIEAELKARGEDIPRPIYEGASNGPVTKNQDDDPDQDMEVEEASGSGRSPSKQRGDDADEKQNFEATSEEDN